MAGSICCRVIAFLSFLIVSVRSQFASTSGMQFQLNGAPFNFAGVNVYDAAFQTNQYATDVVNAAVADGYRVLRCWAFIEYDTATGGTPNLYFQSWAGGVPTVNTGPTGLQAMDWLVSEAERAGLKLILTLTNNWVEYGGMDVYVNNVVGSGAYHDYFYTNPQIRTYWQNYIQAVVSRYVNSPAIFAWELANEARCSGTGGNPQSPNDCNAQVVTSWVSDVSAYIKSIDPNHMVTNGMEGFFNRPATANWVYEYDGASGQDYDAIMGLSTIDFGTIHVYLGNTATSNLEWSMGYMEDHDNCSMTTNKPTVFEEGAVARGDPNYNRLDVWTQWQNYIMSSEGINGCMSWGSLVVDTVCPGDNIYAICDDDTDYAPLVSNWVPQMNAKT